MRFVSDRGLAAPPPSVLSDFYKQEFIKHRECLEQQRAYYSERAISEVEEALARVLAKLDQLCAKENAGEVVSRLLRKFDLLTGLSAFSAWSDHPSRRH